MTTLGEQVVTVRSKNAGPFWLTIDIFCGDPDTFARARRRWTAGVWRSFTVRRSSC